MEASDVPEQPNSFGIKKVVDCKIGEGGQQMYKVEWEATWEPADTLITCQHLIDEFWSFVNKAKANEQVAQQYRKRMMLEQNMNNIMNTGQNFNRMCDDDKTEVQRLIARTNATSAGMLMSPSNMLTESSQHDQRNNVMAVSRTPTHSNNQNFPNSPPPNSPQRPQDTKGKFSVKAEIDSSTQEQTDAQNLFDGKQVGTAGLKYLENFTNPYVKITVVCKICSKEQSLKFVSYWRQHYLTHSDTKPHQCPHCSKSFSRPVLMRKHVESKHGVAMGGATPKQEHMTMQGRFKEEEYPY